MKRLPHRFRVAATLAGFLLVGLLSSCDSYADVYPPTVTDDALEPNNRKSEAATLDISEQTTLVLQDEDWFTFTLDEGTYARVAIEASGAQYWSALATIHSGENYGASYSFGDSRDSYEDYVYLSAGTYYLEVTGYIESSTRTYTVSLLSKALPDAGLEPNDTFRTATKVEVSAEAQAAFLHKDDEDWYTFTLDKSQTVTIDVDDGDSSYSYFNKTLYDSDFEMYRDDWDSLTATLESGTYYVLMHHYEYDDDAYGTSYSLSISSQPIPDETLEPNNSFNEATTIEALPFSGDFFMTKEDEDWFTFSTTEEQFITFNRVDDAYYSALQATLHQENGDEVFSRFLSANGTYSSILPAGTYYVSLRLSSDSYHSDRGFDYSLEILSEDVPSPKYEPNDSREEAHNIALGFSEDTLLVTSGDSDWFTFTLNTTTQVKIAVKRYTKEYSEDYLFVHLYDKDGRLDEDFYESPVTPILTAGTYYIKVSSFEGAAKYGLDVTAK